jgi:hypothetical protein
MRFQIFLFVTNIVPFIIVFRRSRAANPCPSCQRGGGQRVGGVGCRAAQTVLSVWESGRDLDYSLAEAYGVGCPRGQ